MGTLVLDTTTKTIKVAMSGAAATSNPEFTVAYADSTSSSLTEGALDGALNGTSDVTVVSAPASSTRRVIKWITIENKDTAAVTLTVKYDNNGTQRIIANVTLAVGDTWTTDGTFSNTGALKTALSGVGSGTVTSVALSGGTTGLTVSGSPITTSGTITLAGTLVVANGGTGVTTSTGSGSVVLSTSPTLTTPVLGTPTSGTLSNCTVDGTNPVGYRNVPVSSNSTNTLVVGDVGKVLSVTAGQTVPNSTFAAGDVVVIFNNSSSSITLTMSITTAYIAGTDTDKATMTLATRGVATILFISGTVCVVSGNVS
jgi:hypothetical protein